MSKRWFDLLAKIGFALYILYYAVWRQGYEDFEEYWGLLVIYIVLAFALRRFFYNKEK